MSLAWLLAGSVALAHSGAPQSIRVEAAPDAGEWSVVWDTALDQAGPGGLHSDCRSTEFDAPPQADRKRRQWRLECPQSTALNLRLSARQAGPSVLIWVDEAGQTTHQVVVLEDTSRSISPPDVRTPTQILCDYAWAGTRHAAAGLDHLLLLIGLGLAAARQRCPRRATLKTVTAFGLGHAITVGLVGLELAAPPAQWSEAAIALTLVFLGLRTWQGASPPSWRWAAACGLVHGLGFGGGLAQMGLPLGQRLLALGGFNAGVDLTQVLVSTVTVALLATETAQRHLMRLTAGLAALISTVGFAWLWGTWTA